MTSLMLATRDGHTGALWAAALQDAGPWQVLAPLNSVAELRLMLGRCAPTLLVTEPMLADGPVDDLVRTLQLRPATSRVLTLVASAYEDDPRLLDALQAGADSIVGGLCDAQTLQTAVQDTLAGGADIAPWVARRLLDHFGQPATAWRVEELSNPLALTSDEGQLLRRLALGHRLGELAREAGVSARDLAASVRRIYRKVQWTLRAGDLQLV